GTKCPQCHRVLIPARSFCEQCFGPADEWVEVGDQGTIETFSINCMKYVGMPDPPYILAIIRLDGADTGMMHFIGGLDLSNVDEAAGKLKIGTRVQAVWKENREGSITDIEYFRVVDGV
ncbi:MAG: Zn-ribbon domain-containing OB-fold protein, partial [Firmicutes bacterium]|nr:Zn-ribbon domain-containing OB-fold protein [Bacillota bacterium]